MAEVDRVVVDGSGRGLSEDGRVGFDLDCS
jgi:hypothetical protein